MLSTLGSLIGGLGLFLLSMKMISDGLRMSAGRSLREVLGQWTSTPSRGLLAGSGITALVQSSSMVTVATIGFVNAGLLDLYHALGVVYGANVGTTVTGWIVAALGFKIKVEAFALPLIGIGMILRLTGAEKRRGALGEALAGFGLFFIGIDILREAFESTASTIQIPAHASDDVLGILMFVAIGFLITMLTQSSSAAIALVLTAASGGVVNLSGAAAMVIGANVGTTSTAMFAAIGATPNAKRVASAHIIFNIFTGIVALIILPVILWLVDVSSDILGLEKQPAVTLALFHTLFNILGVLLLWPFTPRLSSFLETRFTTIEEIEGKPKHLDKTIIVSPNLTLDAATLELLRVNGIASRMAMALISSEERDSRKLHSDHVTLERLVSEIGYFITQLERSKLPEDVAKQLPVILRTGQYFSQVAELAIQISHIQKEITDIEHDKVNQILNRFKAKVVELISACDVNIISFDLQRCEELKLELDNDYQELKSVLLDSGAYEGLDLTNMANTLEQLSLLRRMLGQLIKGVRALSRIRHQLDTYNDNGDEVNHDTNGESELYMDNNTKE